MATRYAKEFRRAVCKRLVAGEKVIALCKELGVSEATLYLWKRQALIDAGRAEGIKSFEADELLVPSRLQRLARRWSDRLAGGLQLDPWRPTQGLSTRARAADGVVDEGVFTLRRFGDARFRWLASSMGSHQHPGMVEIGGTRAGASTPNRRERSARPPIKGSAMTPAMKGCPITPDRRRCRVNI